MLKKVSKSTKRGQKSLSETPCSRAGPHPRGWRSPGRDYLGEWGAVAKGARAWRSSASKSRAAHQALDAENGHRWLPRRTQETTRRACMALDASGFSGHGRRWPTAMKSGQDGRTGTFFRCVWFDRQPKYNPLRGAALRHLDVHAHRQTISTFEPLISLCSPLRGYFFSERDSNTTSRW